MGRHPRLAVVAAFVAVIVAAGLYWGLDPAGHPFPRCMVNALTGLECPGCGSQRAIHALLHGDIAAAWGYNALLVTVLPLMPLLFATYLWPGRLGALDRVLSSRPFILSVLTVIILWTVYRNL